MGDGLLLVPIVMYAMVMSITPGPNNTMLLASGVNFGFRATIPHMLGISAGVVVMLILTGIGLQQVFLAYPLINQIMKYIGAVYLIYLAWRIANSGAVRGQNSQRGRPMNTLEAALFQTVNPKAWMMVFGFFATCMPVAPEWLMIAWAALLFGCVNMCCISVWAFVGQQLQRFLEEPTRRRFFNYAMAFLLLLTLGMIW